MSYFVDLTTHTYTENEEEEGVLNVGWLGEGNTPPMGEAPDDFVVALSKLCSSPIKKHRGVHVCEFCGNDFGNGQVRVCGSSGIWYSAPRMIEHYVKVHQYLPPDEFIDAVIKPLHIADSLTEADQMTWNQDVRSVFPDWLTELERQRWNDVRDSLQLNSTVKGLVVARAPFGVWIDIRVGFPALLLVPDMFQATQRQLRFVDYPPKGTLVRARIHAIGTDDVSIGLTQNHTKKKSLV